MRGADKGNISGRRDAKEWERDAAFSIHPTHSHNSHTDVERGKFVDLDHCGNRGGGYLSKKVYDLSSRSVHVVR